MKLRYQILEIIKSYTEVGINRMQFGFILVHGTRDASIMYWDNETMKESRWFRRLCFYKILNNQAPAYLYSLLSPPNRHYNIRNCSKIRQIFCRTETFSNSLLPQTIDLLAVKCMMVNSAYPREKRAFSTNYKDETLEKSNACFLCI